MNPRRVQLLVSFGYLGDRFRGVQPQPGVHTAGAALEARLRDAFAQRPRALNFAARTDAGVHARRNIATCWIEGPLDVLAGLRRLEALRDDGLVGVVGEQVSPKVHARNVSTAKRYRYVIEDGAPVDALDNPYAWQIVPRLDVSRMRQAARYLVGVHDFSSFRAARCNASSAVKHLFAIDISGPMPVVGRGARRHVRIDVTGEGFVRKMVRIIVGTLAEVGVGLREPDDIRHVLEARDRSLAGVGAPARGLSLERLS